ncbi:MAG: hypothetical protein HFJ30_05285 [Clostridia bacterium]|nr:hypothetical protein [Clostridia bacterium]MCI9413485.1 hypothetical protein [Clostridia bacterium]
MIVDDKGNVFENRRKNKGDRRKDDRRGVVEKDGGRRNDERRRVDRRKDPSQEKNKEVNR